MNKSLSISSAIAFMFSGLKEKVGSFVILGIIWAVLFGTIQLISAAVAKSPEYSPLPPLVYLLSLLCTTLSAMQYIRLGMAAYYKESLSISSLFSINPARVLQFTTIQYLRGIAIFLGLLLFIFPGIYIMVMYAFPGFTLIDGTADSITGDYRTITSLTKHVRGRLFLANLVYYLFFIPFVPLAFIALLPLMLLVIPILLFFILIAPLSTLFSVHLYEQLKMQKGLLSNEEATLS